MILLNHNSEQLFSNRIACYNDAMPLGFSPCVPLGYRNDAVEHQASHPRIEVVSGYAFYVHNIWRSLYLSSSSSYLMLL